MRGRLIRTLIVAGLLAACAPSSEGPGAIVWDRDVCERCQMVISEPADAAQLRSAHDHRLHFFDDLGCALLWEEEQASAGKRIEEFWVSNPSGEGWLNAKQARYSAGHRTPMDHGFRASDASGAPGELDLEQVRQRVIGMDRERRSTRR